MRSTLLLWLLLFTGASALRAQAGDVSFTAELSKDRMLENSTVEYKLTLQNAQGQDLQPPSFDDFIVLRGPMRSMGTSIINGVGTSYLSFSWQLQPRRRGRLTLGPASIRTQNRTYRTNSRTVEVLKVDASLAAAQPTDFLRAELSTDRAFVGQQIILDLNLYSSTNVISRNLVREPDFDGFFAQPRRQYDGRPVGVIENGREYQRRTLGSVALFPTKSGRIVIPPYRMILGVLRRRSNSSFSRRYTEQVAVNSDTLFVDVAELPHPQPPNFSGGVGTYRVQVQADRDRMTTDDALTLQMTITGEGDIERIKATPPVDERDWQVYDPTVLREEFLDSPTGMLGRKIIEYKVVPRRPGNYRLQPALVYFDVDSADYLVHAPETFNLTVAAGSGNVTYSIDTSTVGAEELSLRAVTDLPAGRRYGTGPTLPTRLLLLLLPVLLAAGAVGADRYREHRANRDPAELARERAARAATARLKAARAHQTAGEARPFYDAVEHAVLGYLRDRFRLPVAELSRRNVATALTAAGAEPALTERYDALLQRCEMALYAGQDQADDLAAVYDEARNLISETERTTRVE